MKGENLYYGIKSLYPFAMVKYTPTELIRKIKIKFFDIKFNLEYLIGFIITGGVIAPKDV
jgi:hypothetical protein